MRCYNGATGDCTTTGVNEPITQLAVTTTLENGLTSKVVTYYNGLSLPTEVDDYDFGASTPTRKTVTTYNTSLTNNISDRPSSVIVYDSTGNVVKKTTYAYDETTQAPMTLPGHTTVSGSRGNPTSVYQWLVSSNQSFRTQYAFDDAGQVTSITDPMGNVTSYGYDAATDAYRTKITRPATNSVAHVSTFAYGPNSGLVTSAYDENNQLTSYVYDSMFRPSSIAYPDGGQTTFSYTSTSKTTNRLQQTGIWNTNIEQYDGYGRIAHTKLATDPDCTSGDKTDTTYDGLGRVYTVSNPYCSTSDPTYGLTTYTYDAFGRTCLVVPPDGTLPTGNTCPTTQPSNTVFATYSGNATIVTDQAGKSRRSITDGLGRLTQVFGDPAGSNYETDYAYDALDNLLCVAQKGTNTGTFSGCASIPASWRPRNFAYDSLSRLTQATNPESGTINYSYDANGNLSSKTAPAPNQTSTATVTLSYCYDTLNRMTAKAYTFSPNTPPTCSGTPPTFPSPAATFTYDVSSIDGDSYFTNTVGRLVRAATTGSSPAKTYFSYDSMGRIIYQPQCVNINCGQYGTQPPWWVVSNGYDLAGNLTSYGDPLTGTAFTQVFDTAGRPWKLTSNWVDGTHPQNLYVVGTTTQPNYTPFGAVSTALLGNGLTAAYAHNNRLQPCRMDWNTSAQSLANCTSTTPTTSILDFTYAYNAGTSDNGNIASWAATGQQNFNRTFTYDNLNRLATMSQSRGSANACSSIFGLSWTIDPWGNRTDQNVTSGTCNAFHQGVNTQNQLFGSPYQYDAAGNMIHDALHSYSYDAENRLQAVDGGATATDLYNADGQRVAKGANSSWSTYYIYATDGQVISDTLSNGSWNQTYLHFNGQIIGGYRGSATGFFARDHLGSTRLDTLTPWVSANQSVYDNMDYLPFGEQIAGGSATTHKFTGKERDSESALDNFGARYMSSTLGRFMSIDPAFESEILELPQTWNRYSYVYNRPLYATDPDGRCPPCIGAIIGGVVEGGFDLGKQLVQNGGHLSEVNWREVGANTLGGAVSGAIAGATGGTSLFANAVVGDVVAGVEGNVVGNIVTRAAEGDSKDEVFSPGDIADDAVAGFVGGSAGHLAADSVHPPDPFKYPTGHDRMLPARMGRYNKRQAAIFRASINQAVRAGVSSTLATHSTNGGLSLFERLWFLLSPQPLEVVTHRIVPCVPDEGHHNTCTQ